MFFRSALYNRSSAMIAHLAEGAQARYHPLGARLGEHGYLGAGIEPERAEAEAELLGQVVHLLEIQKIAAVVPN